MDVWRQLRLSTKILICVMSGMVLTLLVLAILRVDISVIKLPAIGRSSTAKGTEAQQTAVAEKDLSLLDPSAPQLTVSANTSIQSGPGQQYPSMALLETGQSAAVTGVSPDKDWYQIKVPYMEGELGWVTASTVVITQSLQLPVVVFESPTLATPTARQFTPQVTAIMNVNVRNGPGLTFNKVGVLKKGEIAEVLGIDPEKFWWLIVFSLAPDGQGWVSVDYVTPQNASDVPIIDLTNIEGLTLIPTPIAGQPSLTAKTMVNIRSGPGGQYQVLGKIEAGQKAQVLGLSQDRLWVAILIANNPNTTQGWVAMAYITLENANNLQVIP